jgi:hypothetical protein
MTNRDHLTQVSLRPSRIHRRLLLTDPVEPSSGLVPITKSSPRNFLSGGDIANTGQEATDEIGFQVSKKAHASVWNFGIGRLLPQIMM